MAIQVQSPEILRLKLIAAAGAGEVGYISDKPGAFYRKLNDKLGENLTLKDFGGVGDGVTNNNISIETAAAQNFTITPGNYFYSGNPTVDINKIKLENGSDILGYSNSSSIAVKNKSDFVGLAHNYNEEKYAAVPMAPIVTGALKSPPISTAAAGSVDVVAHWYNDFGLDATRQADGGLGSVKWYTWEWAHTNTTYIEGYLADRHPEIGFYRGDDPIALDWICYGLREAGVTAVNLIGSGANFTNWNLNSSSDHWKYQLFNNVPNFKGLKYIIPIVTTGAAYPGLAQLKANFDNIVTNVISIYPNTYTMERDGKSYAVFFIYDGGALRGLTDNFVGAVNLKGFFAYCASEMKTLGYDGAAFLTRNANSTAFISNRDGVEDGWVYISSDYANVFGTTSDITYDNLVDTFGASVPTGFEVMVPNVMPSRESHSFHPSTLSSSGHTPDKFHKMVRKAANFVQNNPHLCPNMISVGNVSEWAEQGPGLIPNMKDGWGYIDALRRGISGGQAKIATTMQNQTVAAGDTISSKSPVVRISGSSSFSFTSTPTIEVGARDGQRLTIIGGGGYTYQIQDNGTLAGSGVETKGSINLSIAAATAFELVWDAASLKWIELN